MKQKFVDQIEKIANLPERIKTKHAVNITWLTEQEAEKIKSLANHLRQIRIYLPKKTITQPLPTVFYFPVTGFVANENSCTYMICSHLCEKAGCQVIEVRNRLAPENPFPIGLSDAYEVFAYFATEWHQYYYRCVPF